MFKKRVLFVCVHNSARSQMAEALLRHLAGDRFDADSAGIEPGQLNPIVVEVMREIGLDVSQNVPKSVQSLIDQGRSFDYIVTVCDESQAERCPIVPGGGERIHIGFPDPSRFDGTHEDKLEQTRRVRDQIQAYLEEWVDSLSDDRQRS